MEISLMNIIANDYFLAKAGEIELPYNLDEVDDLLSEKIDDDRMSNIVSIAGRIEAINVKIKIIQVLIENYEIIESDTIKECLEIMGVKRTEKDYLDNILSSLTTKIKSIKKDLDALLNTDDETSETKDVYSSYIELMIHISNWAKRDIDVKRISLLEYALLYKNFMKYIDITSKNIENAKQKQH